MTDFDWQDANPGAYDPDAPLALLEKAAKAPEEKRAEVVTWAVRSMAAAGAQPFILEAVARDYMAQSKLMPLGVYDNLVRRSLAENAEPGHGEGPSVATQLVQIAQDLYEFGVSDLGEPFALPQSGPKVVSMLRGSKMSLRALLAREFFTRTGRAATQQALADALLVIEGMAQEQEPSRLYMRCAQHDGGLWLDLGDHTGRAVHVTPGGWTVEETPPVLFKRTALTGPLPEPQRGGEISDLWDWVNVAEDDRPLVLAELAARLFSDVPHVVLAIFGEHGTGKTTAAKVLALILDPSPVPVRKPPRDAESWVTMAAGSWVVALDNLSDIPAWLSDSICRASTGDGDVRRKLYTDGDYAVFSFRRCILFDGIDVGALAPDLADRTVPVTLHLIADEDRKDEDTFWSEWAQAHPRLLGAMLDLAVSVMARMHAVEMPRKPRMADYGRVLAAVDAEFGTSALERYADQGKNLAAESLSDDSLAAHIQRALTGPFEGTSAELLKAVTPAEPGPDGREWQPPKDWPGKSRKVTSRMRRLAPAFRKTGWTVTELEPGHENAIRWHISPPAQPEKSRDEPRGDSQPSLNGSAASNASEREPDSGTSTSARKGGIPVSCDFPGCPQPAHAFLDGDYCDRHAAMVGAAPR